MPAADALWGSDAVPIYALDYATPAIDPQAYVHPDAVVIGAVELAAGSSVWPGAVLRGDHGLITVGERTSVQDGTIVHTTEEHPTVIGADCVVGHRAHLEGCVVEDGCLIGSGSLVLNRARVGEGLRVLVFLQLICGFTERCIAGDHLDVFHALGSEDHPELR